MFITDKMLQELDFSTVTLETRKEILNMIMQCVSTNDNHCWNWDGIINKLEHGRVQLPVQECVGFKVEELDTVHKVEDGQIVETAHLYGGIDKYETKHRWVATHRLMYLLCYDTIPKELSKSGVNSYMVYHMCGNSNCCNPLHLGIRKRGFNLKTHKQNTSIVYRNAAQQVYEQCLVAPDTSLDVAATTDRILRQHTDELNY